MRLLRSRPSSSILHLLLFLLHTLTLLILPLPQVGGANLPPHFTDEPNMNNHVLPENSPIGTEVFRLSGVDPEGSPLKYGIMGTDLLRIDERTGVVSVAKLIDREVGDRVRFSLTMEEAEGEEPNVVSIPITITVSDLNDVPPVFHNTSSYEALQLLEDLPVGSKVLELHLTDADLTGMTLSLNCTPITPDSCQTFQLELDEASASAGELKGLLRLAKPLNYGLRSIHQLALTAWDGEHASKVGVLIRVEDVQNEAPIFTGPMAGRVLEDAAVGTLLLRIQGRDGDKGAPREIRYSLLTNPGEAFSLDPVNGRLTTGKILDREVLGSLLHLRVLARELLAPGEVRRNDGDVLETVGNVTILLDDVNDNPPLFNQPEYFSEIPEGAGVGSPLPALDIVIRDPDTGSYSDFTLHVDGPLSEYFDVAPKFASGSVQPVLRLKKSFDHENPNERKFLILLVATNTDEPAHSSSATISLEILDENDNRPQFERQMYRLEVAEDAPALTKIGEILATDEDSEEFGTAGLIYQLVGAGSKRFFVNNRTGEIFTAACGLSSSCLDYEKESSYDLLYMASDNFKEEGSLKGLVPLHIKVLDANDNPTTFDEEDELVGGRTLDENAASFSPPLYIVAKDVDVSSSITYELRPPSSPHFSIDKNTGEVGIVPGKGLPPGNYTLVVQASDGLYTASREVLIRVRDVNNHAPTFLPSTPTTIQLKESTERGSVILRLLAEDKDFEEYAQVSYRLEEGGEGIFSLDEGTGELRLVGVLEAETRGEYHLKISARDGGSPPLKTEHALLIKVEDVYTPLPKMVPEAQRAQASESAAIGSVIHKITLGGSGLSTRGCAFHFTNVTGRDGDNKAVPPTTLAFAQTWFSLDPQGAVVVSGGLQRELVTSLNYSVALSCPNARAGDTSTGSLYITLEAVNDRPPLVEDFELELLEELPKGQAILTIEAEDPEGYPVTNYSILEGKELFRIDDKGEVRVMGRLDYEDTPTVNLSVLVVDAGLPPLSSTSTIHIRLINDNDNDPKFEKTEYSGEILEHSPPGSLVFSVSASDEDVGSVLEYEIMEDENFPARGAFNINNLGEIRVSERGAQLIDRERMERLTLQLKVSDGLRFGYSVLRLRILDANDHAPSFRQKSYHVSLHAPIRGSQEILRVSASDPDPQDALSYSIVGEEHQHLFELGGDSGIIRAVGASDNPGEFRLEVQVSDGEHTDKATVLLQVLPGNFARPQFLFPNKVNSSLLVPESDAEEVAKYQSTPGWEKELGQLSAFDTDAGDAGKVSYYFKSQDDRARPRAPLSSNLGPFRLDEDSGKLFQTSPLDREQMNRHELVVVAVDGGLPVSSQTEALLSIVVLDVDDHTPYFPIPTHTFSIKENLPEGTGIGRVEARDEDEGPHSTIFYFIVGGGDGVKEDIRIDIKSGLLHTAKTLDREKRASYSFHVRASPSPLLPKAEEEEEDAGGEPSSDPALTSVFIEVEDVNDNGPRFPNKLLHAALPYDAEPGREIATIHSEDKDDTEASSEYSLLSTSLLLEGGADEDKMSSSGSLVPSPFRLHPHSGRLTLSSSGARELVGGGGGGGRFSLKISVRERSPPYEGDTMRMILWVVEPSQEAILTLGTPPTSLRKEALGSALSNLTGLRVLVTRVGPGVVGAGASVNKGWSDVGVVAVDNATSALLPVAEFLQLLDSKHDAMKGAEVGGITLHSALPAIPSPLEEDGGGGGLLDAAAVGLIALVAILFMGLAALLACCCCINRMWEGEAADSEKQRIYGGGGLLKYPLNVSYPSIAGTRTPSMTLNSRGQGGGDMIEELATDNPLWIDHKIKSYEEQELTMQVASELDNSGSSNPQGEEEEEDNEEDQERERGKLFSHAYATLHPHPSRGPGHYDQINILGQDTIAVHL